MSQNARYWTAIGLIVITSILLYPGLTQNALTIRGVLDAEGMATKVQEIANVDIPPDSMARVRPFLNPQMFGATDDKSLNERLKGLFGALASGKVKGALAEHDKAVVYTQTQTIIVTIRYLFQNGGYLAGSLLLIFSVFVPIGKVLLFFWALHTNAIWRERLLGFINWIGKWSMADVFVVSIYTAYLGARSSVGVGQPVHFETTYGPGFYWFAAYCVVSLAAQQAAVGLMRKKDAR